MPGDGGESARSEGAAQRLIFSSAHGKPLFDCEATVQSGERRLDMPFFIVEKIASQEIVVRRGV